MINKNKHHISAQRFTDLQTVPIKRDTFLIEYTPETLKILRKHRGLTQSQLASQAALSVDYLSELERGKSLPSSQLCGRLGQALNVIFFN